MARTEAFQQLCHNVSPCRRRGGPEVSPPRRRHPEMLAKEREIYREQARATGKPDAVIDRIVTGKMEKFYEENCLNEQHYIKDEWSPSVK